MTYFRAARSQRVLVFRGRELRGRFFLAQDGRTEVDAVGVRLMVVVMVNLWGNVGCLATFRIEFVVDFFTDEFWTIKSVISLRE
jgi:hypothetical protein